MREVTSDDTLAGTMTLVAAIVDRVTFNATSSRPAPSPTGSAPPRPSDAARTQLNPQDNPAGAKIRADQSVGSKHLTTPSPAQMHQARESSEVHVSDVTEAEIETIIAWTGGKATQRLLYAASKTCLQPLADLRVLMVS